MNLQNQNTPNPVIKAQAQIITPINKVPLPLIWIKKWTHKIKKFLQFKKYPKMKIRVITTTNLYSKKNKQNQRKKN